MGSIENQEWVEQILSSAPFVEWDRFTTGYWDGPYATVYGWIDREDEYKDFVVVILWPEREELYFSTSSSDRTEDLYRAFVGEDLDEHEECKRVEDHFDVPKQTTLTDGGRYTEQ